MALFRTTEELQEYYSYPITFDFDSAKPVLETNCKDFVLEIVGKAQYAVVEGLYNSDSIDYNDDDDPNTALLKQMQRTEALLLAWQSADGSNIKRTSEGHMVGKSDNLVPASQWRTVAAINAAKRDAFLQIDRLLEFLEENVVNYPLWSATLVELRQTLISTTKEFQQYYDIGNSRYLFRKLLPIMLRTQKQRIVDLLGESTYLAMHTEYALNIVSEFVTLLPLAQEIVALHSIAKAIPQLALTLNDNGISLFSTSDRETLEVYAPVETNRLYALQQAALSEAREAEARFIKVRDAEAADGALPTYAASDHYDPDNTDVDPISNTDEDSGIWNGL